MSILGAVLTAVSRCLERRKAMIQKENSISDTIVVRSRTEPMGWSDAEAFFWKEEACFPGRHTRWEVFSRRDNGQKVKKTDKHWKIWSIFLGGKPGIDGFLISSKILQVEKGTDSCLEGSGSWTRQVELVWRHFRGLSLCVFRSGLELNLLEETSEVEELHLKLPPLFDVHDLRCLSVWEGDSELGAAFLRFPTRVPKIGWARIQHCVKHLWYVEQLCMCAFFAVYHLLLR